MTRKDKIYLGLQGGSIMLPNRIALFGYAYSGKSTIAGRLGEYGYKRLSFAKPLKAGWIDEEIAKIYGKTPCKGEKRKIYRLLSDFTKSLTDTYFFIQLLDKEFKWQLVYGVDKFVIDDVRFLYEAEWCNRNLFTLVYVETSRNTLEKRATQNGENLQELYDHISESQIGMIKNRFKHYTVSGEGEVDKEIEKLSERIRG